MQEIFNSELANMVLGKQLPAAAFGEVTKRLLSTAELKSRLTGEYIHSERAVLY